MADQKAPQPSHRKKPKMTLLQIFGSVILVGALLTLNHVYQWI